MAYCKRGHYYDPSTSPDCPSCAQLTPSAGGGAAPKTVYEGDDGPLPAGLGNQGPRFPGLGGGALVGPTIPARTSGAYGQAAQPGAKTQYFEDDESIERLMGFLIIVQSKEEDEFRYMRLKKGVNRIGRFGSRSEIELRDSEASGEHGLVICTNSCARVVDLDSSNGTVVNGEKAEIAILEDGDSIQVGRTRMLYVGFPYEADD